MNSYIRVIAASDMIDKCKYKKVVAKWIYRFISEEDNQEGK